MDRFFLALTLTLFFQQDASAGILSRYFRTVPLEEAHTISGAAEAREFKAESIKVFIWNIKKTQEYDWEEEFTAFGQNRDLFLIQEAYKTDIFNSTLEKFSGVRWDMGISFLYRNYNDRPTGTMIGSKVNPTSVVITHTEDNEPVVGTPKAMTSATYRVQGRNQELLVISIHAINITSHATFIRHMLQAKEQIIKHRGPVLFAGDFNTRTKARTAYLMEMVNTLGFKTVIFKNGELRMRFKFTNNYLDHSFVRGIDVTNAEVIGESDGSDHKPLFLEMSVPADALDLPQTIERPAEELAPAA